MRLISQDGMIDVNYDNGSLVVGVGKYEECISAIITYYDYSCQKGTKLAEYRSRAKALKVMEMLRNAYSRFTNTYNIVFKFPADEEVEV